MSQIKFIRKSEKLQTLLEEFTSKIGRATGFIKRASKMTAAKYVMTLTLGWLDNPEASLNELVQVSEELGVEISASGLHQRIKDEGVQLLKETLSESLKIMHNEEKMPGKILRQFDNIFIIDSSIITLPENMQDTFAGFASQGSEAAVKFQLCFEYLRGNLSALESGHGRDNDQSCTLIQRKIVKNSLFLFDLGYFNQKTFAKIAKKKAFFISRYKYGTHLYLEAEDEENLNLLDILQKIPDDRHQSFYYLGKNKRLKVRLIAERLPPAAVEKRRRKAREAARKKGHTPPKAYLRLLEWSIYITNTLSVQLSFDQIVNFYKLRWQIELIFKVWKSQAKLALVGDYRSERILCQLYARLLGVVIFHWLVAPWRVSSDKELSMTKAFNLLQRHITRLLDSIAQGWHTTPLILEHLSKAFLKHAPKDSRSKKPSTYQRLIASEA